MLERKKHYWNSCIPETAKQLQKQRRKGGKKKPIDVEKKLLPCRGPWPPQPTRREEEEEVAVMPNRAANVTYPPWLSNATTSRHNMPPLLKLPTTEKSNL
jgi:hypothetical protein